MDLVLEKVLLVQEEDDGAVLEPGICDDRFEQCLRLFHSVLKSSILFDRIIASENNYLVV